MKKGLIYILGVWTLLTASAFCAEELLGDNRDGSRTSSVHLLPLYDNQGRRVYPDLKPILSFSTKNTCGSCHTYDKINTGWHFNSVDPNVPPGRAGQPWIYSDPTIAVQIPLSYRSWPGAFKPEQFGISPFKFTQMFGRQTPGGGAGQLDTQDYNEISRQFVSGKLEINCLACHSSSPFQNQAEYASQIANQNFSWAAASSCEFASVEGSAKNMPDNFDPLMPPVFDDPAIIPPAVKYRQAAFDYKDRVLFAVGGKNPNNRCYACHSNKVVEDKDSKDGEINTDVHTAAGLACVDCHFNDTSHQIIRGYEGEGTTYKNPAAPRYTCKACHLGENSSSPTAGNYGSPVPQHKGIPPVHFEKLSCTACHSGNWPENRTTFVKTSFAHGLGNRNVNKSDDVLPHIITPVLADMDGKLTPQNMVWPAYWAQIKDSNVTPISIEVVKSIVAPVVAESNSSATGSWTTITEKQVAKALALLQSKASLQGKAAYIAGGRLYQLDEKGGLIFTDSHKAAKPYLWPIAHDVRPAAQSLGVRNCQDCHSTSAAFSFGNVLVDTPIVSQQGRIIKMIDLQNISPTYMKLFSMSFVFRPWLKVVALVCSAVLAFVVLMYCIRALRIVTGVVSEKEE